MLSVITFVVILSILVLIHELGHFVVAKLNNVCVEEFGFGLPPRLFGLKVGETLYSFNLLPFGGFVKVLGEERAEAETKKIPPELKKRTFFAKKPAQKAAIIIAGVLANFLLGWLVISYLFTQGVPVPTDQVIVEKVVEGSPAEEAGLESSDILVQATVDKKTIQIKDTQTLIDLTKKYAGRPVTYTVERSDKQFKVDIIPREKPPQGEGALGVVITNFIEKKYSLLEAPFLGLIESVKITAVILKELLRALFRFLTFQKVEVEISGPVGIAKITQTAVKFGKNAVVQLLGLLSLNLAVINILPFPALDGGRLSLIVYEWLSKKRVNPKIERNLNLIGFAILLSLIVLITINDMLKIFVK